MGDGDGEGESECEDKGEIGARVRARVRVRVMVKGRVVFVAGLWRGCGGVVAGVVAEVVVGEYG